MRLTVGFTEVSPQHELAGVVANRLSGEFLPGASAIGATRSLITRAEFLAAIDAGMAQPDPDLAAFIDDIRGEDESLMVQLKWRPG